MMSSLNLPETDKNVVSIISGGLDSTIMTYTLVKRYGRDRVFALSYDYNQKQKLELVRAAETCNHLGISHHILNLSILGDIARNVSANISGTDVNMPTIKDVLGNPQPPTYVPFRNMILGALSFSYAEAKNAAFVFTGLQSRDLYGYWDTSQSFVDGMNFIAAMNRQHRIQLICPFVSLSKRDELRLINELDLNVKLEYTLSCYNPDAEGRSCGTCPTCAERIKAFMDERMVDPVPYQKEIKWN